MAGDYDNSEDIENMSDSELRQYVLDQLELQNGFDVNDLEVQVDDGRLILSGRVGTEEELRILDHVITDVIGISDADNQVVIDEIRRAESAMAIDDQLADEASHSDLMLGDVSDQLSPEAEHLADAAMPRDPEQELANELVADANMDADGGTSDVHKAIEDAEPWSPPDSPTPEGLSGQEGTFGLDGRH